MGLPLSLFRALGAQPMTLKERFDNFMATHNFTHKIKNYDDFVKLGRPSMSL